MNADQVVYGGWLDEVDVWVEGQVPLPGMPEQERDVDVEERPK